MIIITQKEQRNQLPKEIQPTFKELKVLQHLRNAGFKKRFGFSCTYLFQIIFVLIFHHKNWFRLLETERGELFPGKDAIYRFLNHPGYAWRRFLTEALRHAPELIPLMIDRVLAVGMTDSYVLMDSWFTYAPLIGAITQRGLDVIGMVKSTNQRYLVNGRKLSLKELYSAATPVQGKTKGILRSIRTHMVPFPNPGMSGRLNRRLLISYFVFLKHYSNHLSFSATSPTGLSCSFALILQDLSARTAITLGNFLQSAIILFAI